MVRLPRPLRVTPDTLAECQQYIAELKIEIWRLDKRWAQLKANHQDADRQGFQVDPVDMMKHLEQTE